MARRGSTLYGCPYVSRIISLKSPYTYYITGLDEQTLWEFSSIVNTI